MTNVTIVGGGLAGMTAALRLLERGCRVSLFEAEARLGGKAGANKHGDDYDEHGYHIFPAWYLNIWRLVDQLDMRDNFVDCTDFEQLDAGEFPRFKTLRNLTSVAHFWENLRSGVMPTPEMFLFFYSTLDLMSQPYSYRRFLDQIAVSGFIRSRFYKTERVARQHQELMLKGISVPTYFVSAMTMRHAMRYWIRHPNPMYRILRGNLQELFIDPIRQELEKLGCDIHTSMRLERIGVEDQRISRLRFLDEEDRSRREVEVDNVVMAIPAEKLAALIDDDVYAAAPSLAKVRYLRARPMAALNVYFKRKITGIPNDHVNLVDSEFGLSFIDVSQRWKGYDATVLNAIASDFTALETLSPGKAIEAMIREMGQYVPAIAEAEIERTDFQPHLDEPLFMNDVGAWHYRLESLPEEGEREIELTNLYPAGDHCRSYVDLVCMEGAVTTGLKAAEALRREAGIASPVEILEAKTHPTWLFVLGKYALLPAAALAKLATSFAGTENVSSPGHQK